MKVTCLLILAVPILSVLAIGVETNNADEEFVASPAYRFLERLLQPPRQVTVQPVSSHNKKGLNGDENWPLYVDERRRSKTRAVGTREERFLSVCSSTRRTRV